MLAAVGLLAEQVEHKSGEPDYIVVGLGVGSILDNSHQSHNCLTIDREIDKLGRHM